MANNILGSPENETQNPLLQPKGKLSKISSMLQGFGAGMQQMAGDSAASQRYLKGLSLDEQQRAAAIERKQATDVAAEKETYGRGFGEEKFEHKKAIDWARLRQAKKTAGTSGLTGKDIMSAEKDLRKEFNQVYTKRFKDVESSFGKVKNASKNPSAANDLSMIFNYMKMLDPGSVVREGEFANAQNAAGIPERVRNMYNRAKEGTRLGDAQRKDFVDSARNAYSAERDAYDTGVAETSGIAKRGGLNTANIFMYKPLHKLKKQELGLKPIVKKESITQPIQDVALDFAKLTDTELTAAWKKMKGVK